MMPITWERARKGEEGQRTSPDEKAFFRESHTPMEEVGEVRRWGGQSSGEREMR